MRESFYFPAIIRMSGTSMVEVLVTLVVVSVGLLGTATLHVAAMQAKHTARSRFQAINLASDLAERIHANRHAGLAYDIASTTAAATPPLFDCIYADCTAAEIATRDLYLWGDAVNRVLPGTPAREVVVDDSTSPTTYQITLDWQEPINGRLTHVLRIQI